MFTKRWPELSEADRRSRSRILVIDDNPFTFQSMFESEGFNIERKRDITKLRDIENLQYDLILLDLHGVGRKFSEEQGLGLLRFLKERNPAQLIVAYSNADSFAAESRAFFYLADATLQKNADFYDFRTEVDRLLSYRFSMGFYLHRAYAEMEPQMLESRGVERRLRRALSTGDTSSLRALLSSQSDNSKALDRVLLIVQTGAALAALL